MTQKEVPAISPFQTETINICRHLVPTYLPFQKRKDVSFLLDRRVEGGIQLDDGEGNKLLILQSEK